VSNRLKYGFINKQGKEIIPLAYDEATNFSQGLAWVKQNNKWYIIDKTGTIVAGEVKGSYQYDEADVGSTVNLDYEQLNDITSVEDAVRVVEQAAQAMTLEQKASATGIDRITLFAEEAAARVNELPLYQSKVTLTELLIEDMTMTASQAKTAVEQVLKKRGIESQRELRAIHRIKIDTAGEPLEIEVEPELGLAVDQPIQIATDSVELTLIPAAITAEIDRSNPLIIKLEKVTSNTTSNQ